MGGFHSDQRPANGVHTPVSFEYADAATRVAATGFDANDVLKFAHQQDDDTIWVLLDITPTWKEVTGTSGSLPTIPDNAIMRGDGGGTNYQGSPIDIDDLGNVSGTLQTLQLEVLLGLGSASEGKIGWSPVDHTIEQFLDGGVEQRLGQEFYVRVYNDSGAVILAGKPVYLSGVEVTEDRPTIALARSDAASTSEVLGLVQSDIADASFGYVVALGPAHDFDTSAFTVGDAVYLDETTAGELRTTPPPEGNFEVLLGYVAVSNATTGRVLVMINLEIGSQVGDAQEIVFPVLKDSAGTIPAGSIVHITGYNNGLGFTLVEIAQADSAATMPGFGILRDAITNSQSGICVVLGKLSNFDTSAASEGEDLYVSESVAGATTATRPTGTALVQKIGEVARSHASQGVLEIFGAGRSNALPNLPANNVWTGNGSGVPAETTPTELTALLDLFTVSVKGLVPTPGVAADGKVLTDDGTWDNRAKDDPYDFGVRPDSIIPQMIVVATPRTITELRVTATGTAPSSASDGIVATLTDASANNLLQTTSFDLTGLTVGVPTDIPLTLTPSLLARAVNDVLTLSVVAGADVLPVPSDVAPTGNLHFQLRSRDT